MIRFNVGDLLGLVIAPPPITSCTDSNTLHACLIALHIRRHCLETTLLSGLQRALK
jgi:hypothetical protein